MAASLAAALEERLGIASDAWLGAVLLEYRLSLAVARARGDTVADMWEATVRRRGEAVALDYPLPPPSPAPSLRHSFIGLDRAVNRVAHSCLALGLGPRDVVAVILLNSPAWVATALGLLKVGVVASMLSTAVVGSQLQHAIAVSRPKLVITEAALAPAVRDALASRSGAFVPPLVTWYEPLWAVARCGGSSGAGSGEATAAGVAAWEADELAMERWVRGPGTPSTPPPRSVRTSVRLSLDDVAMCVFTSGTSGMPKAALITHLRYVAASMMSGIAGLTAADTLITPLPLYHSAGGMLGFGAMVIRGLTLALLPRFSVSSWWREVQRSGATAMQYIGEIARYLATARQAEVAAAAARGETPPPPPRHTLRLAMGNGLRPEVWSAFADGLAIGRIVEFYASTEGTSVLVNVCRSPLDRGAVGRFGVIARHVMRTYLCQYDTSTGERSLLLACWRQVDGLCVGGRRSRAACSSLPRKPSCILAGTLYPSPR